MNGDRLIHPNFLGSIQTLLKKSGKPFDWESVKDDLVTMDDKDFNYVQNAVAAKNPHKIWALLAQNEGV